MVRKSATSQPYSEYLEQRESTNKIIEEYLDSAKFRGHLQKLTKEHHDTEDFRSRIFALIKEYKTNWLGRATEKYSILLFTAIIASVCSLVVNRIDSKISSFPDAPSQAKIVEISENVSATKIK